MKKLSAVILVVMLVLSVTGCSKGSFLGQPASKDYSVGFDLVMKNVKRNSSADMNIKLMFEGDTFYNKERNILYVALYGSAVRRGFEEFGNLTPQGQWCVATFGTLKKGGAEWYYYYPIYNLISDVRDCMVENGWLEQALPEIQVVLFNGPLERDNWAVLVLDSWAPYPSNDMYFYASSECQKYVIISEDNPAYLGSYCPF